MNRINLGAMTDGPYNACLLLSKQIFGMTHVCAGKLPTGLIKTQGNPCPPYFPTSTLRSYCAAWQGAQISVL
jgi:hypothetical protein